VKNESDVVYLGVDSVNIYGTDGPGRPSVRLESKMTFTEGLFVIDLAHMPIGCGVWPGILFTACITLCLQLTLKHSALDSRSLRLAY